MSESRRGTEARQSINADAQLVTFRIERASGVKNHAELMKLWQRMIGHFGRQHTVQLVMIMGDDFRVGFMMNAVDQHLPPERQPLLPTLSR